MGDELSDLKPSVSCVNLPYGTQRPQLQEDDGHNLHVIFRFDVGAQSDTADSLPQDRRLAQRQLDTSLKVARTTEICPLDQSSYLCCALE